DSFPAIPGSSSELAINCTLTTTTGGSGTSYRVEDLPFANWHEGAGRTITTTAATTSTSAVITSSAGHFAAQDVNDVIAAPGIPNGSTIIAVTNNSTVTISQNVFACPAGVTAANCNQVGISSPSTLSTSRQIKDATFISPNKVCSASAGFTQTDVNLPIASVG